MKKSTLVPSFAALIALASLAQAQLPITPGNLVVLRSGDGSVALSGVSTAVYIEEFAVGGGAPLNTIPLPIVAAGANFPLTQSGSAASEGYITVQGSGTSTNIIVAGYGVTTNVNSVATSPTTLATRVVGKIDLNGNIDTTTSLSDAYSTGNIRSACSDNGLQFWTSGSNSGIRYVANLGATTSIQSNLGTVNARVTDIALGNLYFTSASASSFGVSQVGTGIPTGANNPSVLLNGFPGSTGPSPYDFWFSDAMTIYVADDRVNGLGGIQKWQDQGGSWTLVHTLQPTLTSGCRGVTGTNVGGTVTLYATTTGASQNNLVSVVDTGPGSLFTVLATAGLNMRYSGVRIIPNSIGTPTTTFCAGDAVGSTCLGCNNNGAPGHGCGNSLYATGALLTTAGIASTTADTLVLTCSQIPGPGLFFQANGLVGPQTFGDGMLCGAIGIIRMGVVFPTADTASYPGGTTPAPIHIAGAPVNPGDIKHYQCWYRDAAPYCTTATNNTSNGLTLTWQ